MKIQPNFSALLQAFFTDRLLEQRNASPHTIASYRDTFRLLLEFAQKELHKSPTTLVIENLDAPLSGVFSTTWKMTVAIHRGVAISAWRPFTHSLNTWPIKNPVSVRWRSRY